jgi:hypothetical protein
MEASSWKEKVDPAFPKLISSFLKKLEEVKFPSNEGYVYISEKQFEELKSNDFPEMPNVYEYFNPIASFINDEDIINKHPILAHLREFSEGNEEGSNSKILSAADKIVSLMNEDSKKHYQKYYENIDLRAEYETMKEEQRRDYIGHNLSILYHGLIIAREDNFIPKEDILESIRRTLLRVGNAISMLINQKGLQELYSEAKAGDDDSLYKLFKIDKTLFDREWVRRRIRKAMYSGDGEFFKSLSESIKVDPLNNRKTRIIEYLVLAYFWDFGLYRLTIPETMDLFERSGIYMTNNDEIKFRKFHDRFKKIRPQVKY